MLLQVLDAALHALHGSLVILLSRNGPPAMFKRSLTASLVLSSVLASGAQAPATLGPPLATALTDLAPPPPPGATLPNLAADGKGRLWLSWLEPRDGGGHRFRLSSIDLGRATPGSPTWSAPITVAEGTNVLANWADFPSVFVTSDGTLAAHWLERGAGRGEYGIRLRTSKDGGKTWTAPVTPHKDPPAPVEHGFVSFFEAPGAGLGLAWLDGREMAGGHGEGAHGSMTLRSALIANGQAGTEQVIDPKVCECCQTSAARTSDGVIVAYRDRSDGEVRDIAVSRFSAGRWSAPAIVHADDWKISGCPVNGPAVAALGNDVAVAWFSARDGEPKMKVAFSAAGGAFSAPVRLDSGTTYGRLALVMPDRDRAIVSFIENAGDGPQLILREARRDGRTGTSLAVGPMTNARTSGFARLALIGKRLVVTWLDVREGLPPAIRVRIAEIK